MDIDARKLEFKKADFPIEIICIINMMLFTQKDGVATHHQPGMYFYLFLQW